MLNTEELNRLKSIINTLSINQLIWISGYLYGLINAKLSENQIKCPVSTDTIKDTKSVMQEIVLLSASQTGNARQIAKKLHKDFVESGFNAVVSSVGDFKFKKIAEVKLLVFITSTHGEGEPPEEAVALYKYLFSKKAKNMKNTSFVVLSLGDRSYQHFAKAGKDFDRRFEELGAHRLYDRVDVDVDFQSSVDIWRKKIVSLFKSYLISSNSTVNELQYAQLNSITVNSEISTHSKECPVIIYLINKQKITSRTSFKDIHHLEFDTTGSDICYQPGDSLGVWYENDLNLVSELLNLLNLTGNELVNFQDQSLCLKEVLQKYCELTQNTAVVVKNIATISQNKKLLDLLTDQKKLDIFVSTTPIVDVFRKMFINKLAPQDLLQVLRPLKPRFYSISSAQSEVGEEIHITVSVIRYTVNGRCRSGGASSYLVDHLQENDKVRVFIESNNNFRLPKNPQIPIIMIGSGTGIAPFRAFMQQRSKEKVIGRNWLFFGNLKFIDDFLYQTEWQNYVREGFLHKIDTAWSRDQDHKIYVQDKLLQNSFEIWDWIQEGAHVYVCGNAARMARDVEQSLISLVSKHGNMSINKAIDFWNNMRTEKRYQRDIY